jgi:hypothetical protein
MSRVLRSVLAAAVVIASASFMTEAVGSGRQAPAPGPRAGAFVTPAEAAPFIGDWAVTMGMNAFEATFAVSVKADTGKVTATVRSEGQPAIDVSDISLSGKNLVLKYFATMGGNPIATVLTLAPEAAGLRANMAVMDGQFEMIGTGTKQAPGAPPIRATGFGGGRGSQTNEMTDFSPKPAITARTPEEQAKGFMLPAGYRMELVAADPDVISPTLIEFDGNGRMYVGEMISYMMDAETAARKAPWTLPELEASLPRLLDSQQWKLTASHGSDTAAGASSLRGWSTGAPQAQGMWFTVELPQQATVTELQFDSAVSAGRGGRGGPGAPAAAGRGGAGAGAAPVVGYPRGYSVQVSTDGTTWSKPVAEGKGGGPRTMIAFAPVRAKFVRLTQTGSDADAPAWSIRNLRIYEAPANSTKK